MNDYKKLISALRCSASVCDGKCDENCPYRTLEEITPDFPLKADFTIDGIGYWESCDCNRMVLDAADAIEQLVNDRNASVDALKAIEDNGVVVLPCKVGDYVYIPDAEKNIPIRVRVQGISISVSGKPILRFGGYPVESAWGDECGKSWYLTREEAEATLRKMEVSK